MIILLFSIVISIIYIAFLIWVSNSFSIQKIDFRENKLPSCSIIIPSRNDSVLLQVLLSQLNEQVHFLTSHEVIVIDDHSDFPLVADENFSNLNLKVILNNGQGKKAALLSGISISQYNIIITLDADVTIGEFWLQSIVSEFSQKDLNLLCGLIRYNTNNSIFQEFQKMESAAIVSISQAMLNSGFPATCNGANMVFNKSIFYEIGAYSAHLKVSSGDDDLLMHQFAKHNIKKVAYSKSLESIVETYPETNIKDFFYQRIRWISKTKFYKFPYVKLVNSIILLNELIYFVLLTLIFTKFNVIAYCFLFLRYASDLFFAKSIQKFSPISYLKVLMMPFYLLYVPITIVLSLLTNGKWKGRTISKGS
jgi:cellulose synthase/poly-beta-1,6-N-acetylglucosamine synthase-like glycosyltransferase